ATGPDQQRIRSVGSALVTVSTSSDHQAEVAGARKIDRSDDIHRGLSGYGISAWLATPAVYPAARLGERGVVAQKVGITDLTQRLAAGAVGCTARKRRVRLKHASAYRLP